MPTDPVRTHWLYLLDQADEQARFRHAARLAEKAWMAGERVGVYCENEDQALQVDDAFWHFRPDSFLPHGVARTPDDDAFRDPVVLFWHPPRAQDWATLIVLGNRLPEDAHACPRLALIASAAPESVSQMRAYYRQLQAAGVTPQIVDLRAAPGARKGASAPRAQQEASDSPPSDHRRTQR